MDESSSSGDETMKSDRDEPLDSSTSEQEYPTSPSLTGSNTGDFQSIGSGAETPKTTTSVGEEVDFVTADEQSSGSEQDFLSVDDSISLPSPPPPPDLVNTTFPFISHQMMDRMRIAVGSKLVKLLHFVRRSPCALDGLRILPANWTSKNMNPRSQSQTSHKRYAWNVSPNRSFLRRSQQALSCASKRAERSVVFETQSLMIQVFISLFATVGSQLLTGFSTAGVSACC